MDEFKRKAILSRLGDEREYFPADKDTFWLLLENYIYCLKNIDKSCSDEAVLSVCPAKDRTKIKNLIREKAFPDLFL